MATGQGWSFRDGDWPRLRQIIQRLATFNVGATAVPVYGSLTVSDLTASKITATDSNKKLISTGLSSTTEATGFTLAGGTTSKTLTMDADLTASTLIGASHAAITLGVGETALQLSGQELSLTQGNIAHGSLSGVVANEHIDWTNTTNNFKTTGNAIFGNPTTPTSTGTIKAYSTTFPVCDLYRDTQTEGASIWGGAKLERKMTGGTATDGSGIGFFFKTPNASGTSTYAGMFGGGLRAVAAGGEIGSIIFAGSWQNADPATRNHLEIRATGSYTGDVLIGNGALRVGNRADDGSYLAAQGVFADNVSDLFKIKLFTSLASVNNTAGLGFGVHTNPGAAKYMKSAIVHQRKSSWGQGELVFLVDANTDAADVAIGDEVARLTSAGLSVTGTVTASTSITATTGFGCNSKTAQTAYASGGALSAYATGAFGFDSDAHAQEIHTLLTNIRAALVANGIMS